MILKIRKKISNLTNLFNNVVGLRKIKNKKNIIKK